MVGRIYNFSIDKNDQRIKFFEILYLFLFCLIFLLAVCPTSTMVSEQVTKIAGSLPLSTHMVMNLIPVWAGINVRNQNQNI